MWALYAFLLFLLLLLVWSFLPLPVRIVLSHQHFAVKVYFWQVFKFNFEQVYASSAAVVKKPPRVIALRSHYLELIHQVKFKHNWIQVGGFAHDYAQGGILFAATYNGLNYLQQIILKYQIPLDYHVHFVGPFRLEGASRFSFRPALMAWHALRIRRQNVCRESN